MTAISISAQDLVPEDERPDPNLEEKEIDQMDEDLDHLCEELKRLKELLEAEKDKEE